VVTSLNGVGRVDPWPESSSSFSPRRLLKASSNIVYGSPVTTKRIESLKNGSGGRSPVVVAYDSVLRAEVPNWRAEQCRQAQAALRERQLAEARREAGRKRREADVKAAAERHAVEERTREQQRMAAAREERERQAVAAPGGPTQDLQRLVRFVSTWTQPWMVSEELTPVLVVLAGLAPQGFEEWRLRLVSHREANRIPEK